MINIELVKALIQGLWHMTGAEADRETALCEAGPPVGGKILGQNMESLGRLGPDRPGFRHKKSLQIDVEFTTDELEKPGDIILILTNLSDTNFGTFVLNNIKWTPKEALDIIGENRRFKLKMLEQRKEEKFSIPVIPRKIGTINFTSLDIQFNDFSGIKHYLRMDIPSLKIKK